MTSAASIPLVGDVLAEKYRVLRVVADGGMGVVLEAHHELLGKSVALKFPLPELAQVPSIADRFLSEARLCARIENEHVIRILDASRLNGLPYIVMEFVRGTTLSELLGRPWGHARAAAFTSQLLDGLDAVHAVGVVHRDVKPDNVLVVQSARGAILKLVDFGIAKDSIPRETIKRLTRAGALLGTPAYMAPEQIRDPVHADFRADLYSVGILLFEMLSGSSPFRGQTAEALAREAIAGDLRSLADAAPNTPHSLVEIVSRATAVDPAARFQTAAEFSRVLAPHASGWADDWPLEAVQTIADRHPPWTEPGATRATVDTGGVSTVRVPATEPGLALPPPAATTPFVGVGPIAAGRRGHRASYIRGVVAVAGAVALLTALVAVIAAQRRAREASNREALTVSNVVNPGQILELVPIDSDLPTPRAESSVAPETESQPPRPANRPPRPKDHILSNDPRLSSPALASTIAGSHDRLRACNPEGKAGQVLVELRIREDGRVVNASAIKSDASAPVTECVLTTCRALRFPPHDGPDQVVHVPITFAAAAPAPATSLPAGGWVRPSWAIPDGDPVRRGPVDE